MSRKSNSTNGTNVDEFLDRCINAGKKRLIPDFDEPTHETLIKLATQIKENMGDKLYCLTEKRFKEFAQRVPLAAQLLTECPDENEFEASVFTFTDEFKLSRLKCKNCLAGFDKCHKRKSDVTAQEIRSKSGLEN
jgi:hypothetical protein